MFCLGGLHLRPFTITPKIPMISATVNGFLGPNYGGQDYDAEFLGATISNSSLYLAIATGQRPDNGYKNFSPGDIRIETSYFDPGSTVRSSGPLALRLAEAIWTQHPACPINAGAPGTTYVLNINGFTTGQDLAHNALHTAGSVWETSLASDWINDPIPPPTPTQLWGEHPLGSPTISTTLAPMALSANMRSLRSEFL